MSRTVLSGTEAHFINVVKKPILHIKNWFSSSTVIIIIITSYAPISLKIKLSGATKPRG